ncbi:MAG TPA: PfkB family carbohydrate kinase [Kribbellaceae bacterium]|nr:PfkB family carbohydrate kinase [Kribbellaceae bacterium]
MADVVVVGSANVDLVLPVERIPRPGETVLARGLSRGPGGKGANQAAAAARAGAATAFAGCLGDDESGAMLRAELTAAGVGLDLVRTTETPTGTAIICVDDSGENAITVAPSANGELVLDAAALEAVRAAAVVLLQLEIPRATVREAARAGRYVVLNAAPAAPLDDDLLSDVDLLVVNEHEAAVVSGVDAAAGVAASGEALLRRVPAVVVTLGGDGALVLRRGAEPVRLPGHAVPVVDTTGAGDTFCGVLAATLSRGAELPDAVRRANAAAALSVGAPGAMTSVPSAAAIDALLA